MADDLYDKLKDTAIKHVRAYESPNPFNPEAVYQYRAPGCYQYLHPENSMPPPWGNGTKIEWDMHAPGLRVMGAAMEKMRFDIKEVAVDVKRRVVTVRLQGIFDFRAVGDEPPLKDHMIEYTWMTEHDESGEKIVRVEETLDVAMALVMLEKAGKYAEEQGQ